MFYLCIFFHVCSLMFSFTSNVHRVPLVCVSSVDVLRLYSQDDGGVVVDVVNVLPLVTEVLLLN